jgi:predicted ArsR family transcriptional regulator
MALPSPGGAEPLAQPTRARLFALLEELDRPAPTRELAERLRLHPNGVRTHMERLAAAGLVERSRSRKRRGRPRDEWSIAPGAAPSGGGSGGANPQAYQQLGRWLARAIPARKKRLRDVEAAGRAIGQELAAADGASDATLASVLTALGFQPSVWAKKGKVGCSLGACPYRDAVKENRDVVCTLHRGLTRGLLDTIAPESDLTSFVPHDPDTAGCVIEVRGLSDQAAGLAEAADAGQ